MDLQFNSNTSVLYKIWCRIRPLQTSNTQSNQLLVNTVSMTWWSQVGQLQCAMAIVKTWEEVQAWSRWLMGVTMPSIHTSVLFMNQHGRTWSDRRHVFERGGHTSFCPSTLIVVTQRHSYHLSHRIHTPFTNSLIGVGLHTHHFVR